MIQTGMIKNSSIDRRLHGLNLTLKNLAALKVYAHGGQLKSHKKSSAEFSGNQAAVTHGRGMDFAEVRRYQAGDDIRSMDWRVTARTGKPHTKLFKQEREQPVYLFVNLTASMQFGTKVTFKSIIAAQVAALLAWKTVINKDRIGGFIYNDHSNYFSKANPSNQGVLPFLQKIIQLNNSQPTENIKSPSVFDQNVLDSLRKYHSLLKHGNKIFIISDFCHFDEKEQAIYTRLSSNNHLHFMHIYDVLEAEAPNPNFYSVSNGKTIHQFDSSSMGFQQRYNELFIAEIESLKKFCAQRKIDFTSIRTDADVITELQRVK